MIPAGEVLGEHVVEDDILEILQLIDVPLQGGQPLQPGQAPLQLFYLVLSISVANLDPEDPYVLGPPGFGFRSGSYYEVPYGSSSGSRSLYIQAELVRKSLIPTFLRLLYDFLSLKNYVNVASKSNMLSSSSISSDAVVSECLTRQCALSTSLQCQQQLL